MTTKPLVTIVIPVYNGSNFLAKAIDSALAQTYENIEILVVNDGSSDNNSTRDVATSYGEKIRYLEKENGGAASALNYGITAMNGEYFSWLSHDDVFLEHKIKDQVTLAVASNCKIIYSNYVFIDQVGTLLQQSTGVQELAGKKFLYQLLTGYPINGCTTLIHKSVFNTVGGFNEQLETTQDYDLWFRCASKFTFTYFDSVVLKSRVHPYQDSVIKPWRQLECDELYTRIGRAAVKHCESEILSDDELFDSAKSLVARGYLSATFMVLRGIKRKQLKLRLLMHIFRKNLKGAISIGLNRKGN